MHQLCDSEPDHDAVSTVMKLDAFICLQEYPQTVSPSLKKFHLPHVRLHASTMPEKKMTFFASLAHTLTIAMIIIKYSSATLQNITLDDAYAGGTEGITLLYLPVNKWNIGNTCNFCWTQPDPTRALDNTWHDASSGNGDESPLSIGLNFTGEY